MNTAFDSLTHKMQRAALGKTVDLVLSHAEKDPAKTVGQIVDLSKQFYGDSFSEETYAHAKQTLTDPNSKWSKLINCMLNQLDPNVARTTALNLGYEAFFRGTKTIRENRVKYHCNIPWLILFDPTSACNMHCVGCWAGEYGHKNNLSFDDMDKIVTEGKELGVYLYMLTGGEPLVRKADILKLAVSQPPKSAAMNPPTIPTVVHNCSFIIFLHLPSALIHHPHRPHQRMACSSIPLYPARPQSVPASCCSVL